MSITPVAGMVYANQGMSAVSSKQTDFQNRLDAQNLAAGAQANDKSKEVAEVRPTEELYKIDPEKEHEKKRNQQENGATEEQVLRNEHQDDEEDEEIGPPPRLLDITI